MTIVDVDLLARLVVDHVNDGIVLTDKDGRVLWINPAFTKISGFSLEDMMGQRPGDILQGKDTTSGSKATLSKAIANQEPCVVDIMNYAKCGRAYISEINLNPIFSENGTLQYFVAVQRDVTEQRSKNQQSVDFEAYQRALDQQAIVSVADRSGKITYVNNNFCEISEYSSEELVGQDHRIVNSRTHDRAFFRQMWRDISRGKTWHGEVCNVTKFGFSYWVDTTIVPVHAPTGEIARYVSIRYDITERKVAEDQLRVMADTDGLTGLMNRTCFHRELENVLAEDGEDSANQAWLTILLDLDHFKDLNDTVGHNAGDLLLKEASRRLLLAAGEEAKVARLGGDEFAILLPSEGTHDQNSKRLTEMHASLSEPTTLEDLVYIPSFSMGVTIFPEDNDSVAGTLINADIALYEAKRNGRNQWCFFDPSARRKIQYREKVKSALDYALSNDSFDIVFQPIYEIPTHNLAGFEVLTRLTHEGEDIPPEHFIPICEDLGIIGELGNAVLHKALRWLQHAKQSGANPGFISVNVAPQQLRHAAFVDQVQEMMLDFGVSGQELLLEITETALIGRSVEVVAHTICKLREIGVSIALDDFGTGFSSLSHLRDFQVDKVKIDKSFVSDLEKNESDKSLVVGLIGLVKTLSLDVVAEGVETLEQIDFLKGSGCDYMQGYALSHPLTGDQAFDWTLRNSRNFTPVTQNFA